VDELRRLRRYHLRAVVLGAVALVFTLCLLLLAWVVDFLDFMNCAVDGFDSNYGELEWSVLPPGPQCVYTEEVNGFDAVVGPSWMWSVGVLIDGVLIALTAHALVGLLSVRVRGSERFGTPVAVNAAVTTPSGSDREPENGV
jgi:hypothetical protein